MGPHRGCAFCRREIDERDDQAVLAAEFVPGPGVGMVKARHLEFHASCFAVVDEHRYRRVETVTAARRSL